MSTIFVGGTHMWRMVSAAIAIVVAGGMVFAQGGRNEAPEGVNLTGDWAGGGFTEHNSNTRRTFDFLGIPLSEAGRAWTLSHSEEQISEPERQCAFYTSPYFVFGFAPLPMWKETDLRMGGTTAWVVGGWVDVVPMVIWMDGRPHPSKYAPHSAGGFTTGVWENDVLTTYTTHMKANSLHRRAPHSDLATMTLRFSRHADILSLTGRIEDPVYLAEPFYVSREWTLAETPVNGATVPCTVTYEGIPTATVPHFLPGQNPVVDEMTSLYGIPLDAVKGGPETMYPEYRKKIKDHYRRPEKCVTNANEQGGCGGPGRRAPNN